MNNTSDTTLYAAISSSLTILVMGSLPVKRSMCNLRETTEPQANRCSVPFMQNFIMGKFEFSNLPH